MNPNNPTTKWVMLGLAYLVLVACFIPYIGWSVALLDILADFELTNAQAGLLGSITALIGGLVLPFAGVIGDRIGTKKIILVGLVAAIVGQLLFAYAPDYALLMLGRAVSGLGVGLLFVGPYTMAVNWFQRERRSGIALGIMFTSDGIGSYISLYAFAIILTAYGWRTGSTIGTAFLAVIFLIVAIFLKDAPKPEGDQQTVAEADASGRSTFSWLMERNVIAAALFFIGEWGIFAIVAVWMPTILIEGAGWDPALAGLLSSLYVIFGILPSIIFGQISDSMNRRKPLILSAGLVMAIALGLLTMFLATGNYTFVAILLPVIGLGVYTGMPVAMALATDSVPANKAGAVNGFVLGIGFIVGGFVYPWVMGMVKDSTGEYTAGFVAMVVATVILNVICPLILKDTKRAAVAAPAAQPAQA